MSEPTVCPCEGFIHPQIVANRPGRDAVDYRIGDYAAFRRALLLARQGETALSGWHPAPGADLGLQMLEWWAYLADVLTFYNERALNEVLLRTAVLPEDVRRIVRLLGYRPRPGIGATGLVAAETDSVRPFTLPRGFPLQGTSASGGPAQIFELDEDTEVGRLGRPLPPSIRFPPLPSPVTSGTDTSSSPTRNAPSRRGSSWSGYASKDPTGRLIDAVRAKPPRPPFEVKPNERTQVSFRGVIASLKADDTILFLKRDWNGRTGDWAYAVVREIQPAFDEHGRPITTVTLLGGRALPRTQDRDSYRILHSSKLAHLWLYHDRYPVSSSDEILGAFKEVGEALLNPVGFLSNLFSSPPQPPQDPRVLSGQFAHLEAITRGMRAGDPVLFDQTDHGKELVRVTGYSEEIWYANPPEPGSIGQGPPVGPPSSQAPPGGLIGGLIGGGGGSTAAPIPIPHSKIAFEENQTVNNMVRDLKTVVVHYGWQEVGEVVDGSIRFGTPISIPVTPDGQSQDGKPLTVSVDPPPGVPLDVRLPVLIESANGTGVAGWLGTTTTTLGTTITLGGELRALLHLLPVSRGQTVPREILGSGDPALLAQEFVLQRSPLTYLADTGPRSMDGYRSTLRIRVDGIEWLEVPTFHGQGPDARVFVTREDDAQKTHVRFGDGENGARLPAGAGNVVATYRYGSGAEPPAPQSLTTVLRPQPGLKAIRNPVSVEGGADPDPPEQVRRYAPRSVLAFGRAISGDDYETVAAQTPGVARARVYFTWDARSQRTLVKVYVGDTDAAVSAAQAALQAFGDPNRPVVVALASPVFPDLTFTLEVDPAYDAEAVNAAVRTALLDPRGEPFGSAVVRIGQVVYDSQIYDACLRVPGVVAVRDLEFRLWSPDLVMPLQREVRHSPGEGGVYLLRAEYLHVHAESTRHAR